jgi:DNA-binding CsgD family transcriptional regulator
MIKCVDCNEDKNIEEFPRYKTGPKSGKTNGRCCKVCYAKRAAIKRGSQHYKPIKKTTKEIQEQIITLYQQQQMYPSEISAALGFSTETIQYHLRKSKVKRRTAEEWSEIRYGGTKEERKRIQRKRRNQRKMLKSIQLIKPLLANGCVDCGEKDIMVLEFDHREPNDKTSNISRLLRGSFAKLQTELQKCDVVCANCHRRRTAKMFGSWRFEEEEWEQKCETR